MVLVNGAEGIGTGWATSIPNYDPRELIDNMRLFIKKKPLKVVKPWYRGFTGTIKPTAEKGKMDCVGVINDNGRVIQITELPIRRWTQDYKEFLQGMLPGAETYKKSKVKISDIREYHTENRVNFMVKVDHSSTIAEAKKEGLDVAFKLRTSINETNMVLFDSEGKINKYSNVVDIMREFAKMRLKFYDRRKQWLVAKLTLEKELLSNRARFIGLIIAKKLHINNRKKKDIVKDLTRLKFRKFGDTAPPKTGFEYLLTMQIASLTYERKLELEAMFKAKADELAKIKKTTIQQMWSTDLDALEGALLQLYKDDATPGDAPDKIKKNGEKKGTKRKSAGDDGDAGSDWGSDAEEMLKRPAAAGGKKMKLWKGAKKGRGGGKGKKGRRGAKDDSDEDDNKDGEEEEGEDGEKKAAVDPDVNIFADTGRWTAGLMKPMAGVVAGKKRRL